MTEVLIALGANMSTAGRAPASTLRRALERLSAVEGVSVRAVSHWYRTPAWPPGSGADFVNGAAILCARPAPTALLQAMHGVESVLGRTRSRRWGPRVCDLDLLGIGDAVLPDRQTVARWMALSAEEAGREMPDQLILPHPRLHERAFVLVPLADVAPGWRHPMLGQSVAEMRGALPATALSGVVRL